MPLKTYVAGIVCLTYFFSQIDVYDMTRFANELTDAYPNAVAAWWVRVSVPAVLFSLIGAVLGLIQAVMSIAPQMNHVAAGFLVFGSFLWFLNACAYAADSGMAVSISGQTSSSWSGGEKFVAWLAAFVGFYPRMVAMPALTLAALLLMGETAEDSSAQQQPEPASEVGKTQDTTTKDVEAPDAIEGAE